MPNNLIDMKIQGLYTIVSNEALTTTTFKMIVSGCTKNISAPGQFVNIKLDGSFLRRPISICDWNDDTITLIYKVVGEGTKKMSEMVPGEKLDMLVGLGNGFSLDIPKMKHPLLIGGGVGVPPLFALAKKLKEKGCRPTMIMGFNTAEEVFYFDEFKALEIETIVSTVDGSGGIKGFVTDAMEKSCVLFDYTFCCGPLPMLKAIYEATHIDGQFSFEERMGCGFGACMGCTCKTNSGNKRICKEGPILFKNDIIF